MAEIADMALTEHQMVADVGNVAAFAQQLEIPGAVHGVAIHHRTGELVVLDHQFFVDTAHRVGHQDFFIAFATGEVAS